MTVDLEKKVKRGIRLIQAAAMGQDVIEIAYSGGKDSDVILELAKMAGVKYRVIYKNTTIDPKGTIAYAVSRGAEIINPEKTFIKIIEEKGFPTFRSRFCCEVLKEYRILDVAVHGIRRTESIARKKRYKEPEVCRNYGGLRGKARIIYPILDWTDNDVLEFIVHRGVRIHPLYYRSDGTIDVTRRLGCQCCPMKSCRGLSDFRANPRLVLMWLKAGLRWWNTHPNAASHRKFSTVYDLFVHNIFFDTYEEFMLAKNGMFGTIDCKQFLSDYFNIKL